MITYKEFITEADKEQKDLGYSLDGWSLKSFIDSDQDYYAKIYYNGKEIDTVYDADGYWFQQKGKGDISTPLKGLLSFYKKNNITKKV